MSWYKTSAGDVFRYRWPIAVSTVGVGAGGATTVVDVSAAIPADWDAFWENVQGDGDDVYITDADGVTLLDYQLTGWSQANRTGTIEVNNWTAPDDDALCLIWVYWGNATVASAAGAFTVAAAKTGYIYLGAPVGRMWQARPERYEAAKPKIRFTKSATETVGIWLDMSAMLAPRVHAHNGGNRWDEVAYCRLQVLLNGADQTAVYTEAGLRFSGEAGYIRLPVKGGSTGTTYTVSPTVGTAEGDVFNPRAMLKVKTVAEQ